MKTAELAGVRNFRLIEEAPSPPAPGEVQVRVQAVGICGSDLHYYAEGCIGDTECVYPMVLGHEPTGEVVRLGQGVSGWQPGDRVILEPALYCYHCEFCMSGRHNICSRIRFLSTPGEPGFFREVVSLPGRNVLALPQGVGYAEGTLFEPLAIVLHSMKMADPRPGDTALVFGAGPIGLVTLSMLKMCGAGRTWAVEPVAHRRQMALDLGADAALDPAQEDVVKTLKRETGNRGFDVVIDCAAQGGSMNHCLYLARNGGRVVYTGIPSEAAVPLNQHEARRKELVLYNVRRSNHETELALRLLSEQAALFASIVTHTVAMDRIGSAFSMLEHYEDGAGKVTIAPS
jgi:L-iditol 2-dehydrogenase